MNIISLVSIGEARVGPLMGQSGEDVAKRKEIQLLVVLWRVVESLRNHKNASVSFTYDY